MRSRVSSCTVFKVSVSEEQRRNVLEVVLDGHSAFPCCRYLASLRVLFPTSPSPLPPIRGHVRAVT